MSDKKFGLMDAALAELTGNAQYVDEGTRIKRLETCAACPKLIKLTNQCSECGCFVKAKTRYAESSCPIGKWGAVKS